LSKITARNPSQEELGSLLEHYQNARYEDAEKLALSITQEFPDHPYSWTILGVLLEETGRASEALNANQRAVQLEPQAADGHYNLANTFRTLGRLEEAEASYLQALALAPEDAGIYYNLGVTLQGLERLEESRINYKQATTLKSDYAEAHYGLGLLSYGLGKFEEAATSYRQLIALQPNYAEAHYNLGTVLQELSRLDEAEASYMQAIALRPDYAGGHNNLGNILQERGRLGEAEASYAQAIVLEPHCVDAHYNLGNMLEKLGRVDEAEASLRQAIALKPDYAEAQNNLGIVLQELGRLDESEAILRQAIAVKPDHAGAHNNLGVTLKQLGRLDESEASFRQAIAVKPDYAGAHTNLGNTLRELGRLENAEASLRQAIALKPDYAGAHSNLLFLISGFNYEAPLYVKEAQDYGRKIADTVTSRFSSWSCEEEPKTLRIGLVSGDLSNHPVGYFIEGLLNLLSRSKLELFAYPTKLFEDDLTVRIKPRLTEWQPIVSISDEAAANLIHSDGIHILIDLSGHTDKNRLPIFAWKPAPIQISWLGYFASTGVAEIDYILGDPYVTPVEEADNFVEKIWQLPESYLCLTEPYVNVDVCQLPALENGSVMFGCFNKIERMNDNVVVVWASILKAIPNSRLFLKDNNFSDSAMREAVFSRFELVGIGDNRLILEGRSPRSEYLAAYNRVDIALSPFPYGGGTTSAEGLWMGVPVITKRGDCFLSHLGESIAHNAGLPDWIAANEDEYIAKAVKFSADLNVLIKLRAGLREQVLASPLFDAPRFASNFEKAVWSMWSKWKEDKLSQ